ncbi:MAG: CCXG family PEP-CTERM protein [Pseudomonadota bacterium]
MNRSNRSLHLVGSLAAALAGAAAVTGLSSPAEAQIVFDTVSWPLSPQPGSTATAISTFDALAGTADIGCLNVASLNGLNNQSIPGGGSGNIGYHEAAVFVVGPAQAGTWQFRWGADFGRGGTLLVDGVELQSRWTDMWWSGAFSNPTQYLAGMVNLTAGTHIVEVFGFEDCCDGPGDAQFLSPDSVTWRDISTANLNVVPLPCGSASLLVTDTVSPNPVNAGMAVTYTLFYESTGTIATTPATLVQELSPSLTFVSASTGGTYDPATRHVTWSVGPLGVGMSGSVTVTATVNAGVPDQTSIVDLLQLSASNVSATATATSTVLVDNAAPMLAVGMTPDPVNAGDQLTVGLTYGNAGSIDATNATLTDVIPANTTFVQAMGGGTFDATTRTITWSLGTIPSHGGATVSYVISVPNPVANHTPLIDMASLTANNTSTVTGHATAYTKSAPLLTFTDVPNTSPVAAGAPLSYTLSWSNIGSDAANDSVIQWALPAHVTFQTANNGGTYDSASNKVIWNLGSILSGSMGGVTVTVLVDSPLPNGTQLIDQAALLTSNGGMQMANTTVNVNSAPALVLTETGAPNPVAAGGQLVYTLAYGNGGTDSAQNAAIVAAVPANTSFVSATGGGTYDSGANSVTFGLGALAGNSNLMPNPLGSVTFTVNVASPLANGTTLTASAMLSADNATGAPAVATDKVQSAPTLSLTNTGMPSPIDPGSLLTYTIAYANNGTDAAHGVTVTDVLPSGVTIMSASNGGSYDTGTNTVTWSLADLAAGASGSITLTVLVNSSAPAGMLTDTAVLSASNIANPIPADAMTAVNAVATGAAGSSGTGAAGSSGTGVAGSSGTGAGGSTGVAGSSGTGAGGTSTTGVAGSSGTGGTSATGTAGTSGTGAGGTSATGTAGTSGTGAGGTSATGTAGTSGTGTAGTSGTGAGGTSATGSGGSGASAGGSVGTGTGGSTGAGGSTTTGGGGSTSTGGGGHGMAGAGGGKATGGGGQTGTAGSGQTNASGSGCDCAVATSPTPGSLLWLVPMAMVFTVTRRRRR